MELQLDSPTLTGSLVTLSPIEANHGPLLRSAAGDDAGDIFRWFPYPVSTKSDFEKFVETALAERERGVSIPFATIEKSSGRVIGSSRFMNIDRANRRVEIGSTWIAPAWQRTGINTEAKYLMLRHAFEQWRCIRVELKTDSLNTKSRTAILGIGAKEEGTLRQHMVTGSGRLRDTVYFSILDREWPEVKANLEARLARRAEKVQ